MIDIDKINWIESQNTFSKSSRSIIGHNLHYTYYKDHVRNRYRIGRFRYSIDGEIKTSNIGKDLDSTGVNLDGKAYYWHYFHNSCCFDKSLNYDTHIDLQNNRFIVNKVNTGKWNFNHNAFTCIIRSIAEVKLQLKTYQSLVVLLPSNKNIEEDAQKKYHTIFIEHLRKEKIRYAVGGIKNIKDNGKQLVVFVIDIVTTIKRKNRIINDIRKLKGKQKPLIALYSLVVIFDGIVGQFCIDLHNLRTIQEKEKKATKEKTYVVPTPPIDEEELIMRSLAGYGPDPEIFGF